ncbi:hypothetical protein [Erythrobacter crassostreae]|uniref:Autotransporter domain-containing protein n=1 Tax=Erythrobacter crassostreae TaxID=2828328 RepID=A0A9X1F2I2_9SPHN|nr:hypothetical protein [Erythrobacter crassostrea]MBV7259107.1 hypothetical protein [Erythrobacter crassostrea]
MTNDQQTQSSALKLSSIASGVDNFLRFSRSAMLRGGRVTKFKGVAASYSPELGLVTAGSSDVACGGRGSSTLSLARRLLRWSAAPLALAAASSPAFAQAQDECVEVTPGSFVCEDNGDPATTEQDISNGLSAVPVVAEIQDGFDIDTTGTGEAGLSAGSAEGITITLADGASSTIIGDTDGVRLDNEDDGAIDATFGNVTGLTGDGIDALNTSNNGGGLALDTTAGAVIGGANGIDVLNRGSGVVSVTTGNVTGQNGDGVQVGGNSNTSDIFVDTSAGTVSGSRYGVNVDNFGYGAATIITGDVVATNRDGIDVSDDGENGAGFDGTDIFIDSSAGSVTGGDNGIEARNFDTGDLTIITGDVTGLTNNGVRASNGSGTTDLTIDTSAGAVYGFFAGVNAFNSGTGSTTIITGDVDTGYGETGIRDGVYARNNTSATDLIIDSSAGWVEGQINGIRAIQNGSGDTVITTADVDGESGNGNGIDARNNAGSGSLTIDSTAGAVRGGGEGIRATNSGTGNTNITTADVRNSATNQSAIVVFSRQFTGDLNIDTSAGTVRGGYRGISGIGYGTGNISVVTADVTAVSNDAINISDNGEEGVGVDIAIDTTQGALSGGRNGLYAGNNGTGDLSITTADVSGAARSGIYGVNRDDTTGNLSIDSTAGTVFGARYGIDASNAGVGDLTITTAAVTGNDGSEGNAITARNSNAAGGAVTINTVAGAVTGGDRGIYASNDGSGGIAITTADVTTLYSGEYGQGIDASDRGAGSLSIDTTAGAVSAVGEGIRARNNGGGGLSITAANVTSANSTGINASVLNSDGDAIIDTTAGVVTGGTDGINLNNDGSGDSFVVTGAVTGTAGNGIEVYGGESGEGVHSVDSTGGAVIGGGGHGILVTDDGGTDIAITTADVTGASGDGIRAIGQSNNGKNITIDTTAGTVTGLGFGSVGIETSNQGTGDTNITTADVFGSDAGISVSTSAGSGEVSIDTSAGTVDGGFFGIVSQHSGTGRQSITTGDVSTYSGDAISASNSAATTTDLVIDSTAGQLLGRGSGIVANNLGTGYTRITAAGVTGSSNLGDGIQVTNDVDTTDLVIDSTAGPVIGGDNGIYARNDGTGDTSITTADVTGERGNGIDAQNAASAGDLTINTAAGAVVAADDGINVINDGTGSTNITAGDVTAGGEFGIFAYSYGTDLIIDTTAGTVTAVTNDFDSAIYARNYGSGEVVITTGALNGSDYGVYGYNSDDGTDLTIDTRGGAVVGGFEGVEGRNDGSGALTILTADVTGGSDEGIEAFNEGTDLTINSSYGSVLGEGSGIYAENSGSGILSITAADVSGQDEHGVEARNFGTDLIVNTAAGSVIGGESGIYARNVGTGVTSITTANVTGTGTDYDGIYAVNTDDGTDVIVDSTAGAVTGDRNGINVRNNGTGNTSITTADVTGQTRAGIYAYSGFDTGNLTVDSTLGSVAAFETGVAAIHGGSGDVNVITADVTSQAGVGVYAYSEGVGDLVVNTAAGAVSGDTDGVYARHIRGGDVTVVAGDVIGNSGDGVKALLQGSTGNLTINTSAGAVSGGQNGINAENQGSGILSITTADVSGGLKGILARTVGIDLVINSAAGAVSGGVVGIDAQHNGTGTMTIITADVTGDTDDGISALNTASGADLIINSAAGTVTGAVSGIDADNDGAGALIITSADAIGAAGDGITADNSARGTDLLLNSAAGDVSGGLSGISAVNNGTGGLIITAANAEGVSADGINAFNSVAGLGITINSAAGAVSGENNGIAASNEGSSVLLITTADVTGTAQEGILASNIGVDTIINSTAGAVSGGTSGVDATNATGLLVINTADVSGAAGNGITAANAGTELIINSAAGSVTGSADGIVADNQGTSILLITTADVTGGTGDGINARNSSDGSVLIIDSSAGAVSGGAFGILASNRGSGDVRVTTGDVTVAGDQTEGQGDAVNVRNSAAGGNIAVDTTAGTVSGLRQGVYANQNGIGDLSITTADVNGVENGVTGFNQSPAANLSIDTSAGSVNSVGTAVLARNYGSGVTSVVTGNVTSTVRDGVNVRNATVGGDIAIDTTAGAVTGAEDGIDVYNDAPDADTTIITGDVTGQTGAGILVSDYGEGGYGAGDITINSVAGAITGATIGIDVENRGVGDLSITTADVAADAQYGIRAENSNYSTGALTIDTVAGDVTGNGTGIFATNFGAGALSITTGDVAAYGEGQSNGAIFARNDGTDLIIDTSAGRATTELGSGINATNNGTGVTTITTADVESEDGFGIFVNNGADTTGLTIDTSAGAIEGVYSGIEARNNGSGETSITTANVTGGDNGIDVDAGSNTGPIAIDTLAGAVSAQNIGILVETDSGANITVTSADVTTEADYGVNVISDGPGGDITIDTTAGAIVSGSSPISARQLGDTGTVRVTTGDVETTERYAGVFVFNDGDDTYVDTSAGSATGISNGVFINHSGSGDVILTTADVTGAEVHGVRLSAGTGSINAVVDTSAGQASGFQDGVNANHGGTGSLTITTANVDGQNDDGIFGRVRYGTDLTIDSSAGAVTGNDNGVYASNDGSGFTSITTADVTATSGDGVTMMTGADTTILDIDTSAGAVTGSNRGIYANHAGSGDLTITVGNVTGQSAEGILASTSQDTANIFVQGGDGIASNVIGATDGIALTTQGADITITGLDSVTGQAGDGLNLVSNGGNIAVSDIGTVSGLGGNGIFAVSDAGNITIENVGLVGGITATGGIGIAAYAENGGTITIGTSGDVSGETYGVDGSALGGAGDITIDTTNYAVNAAIGIRAVNSGGGDTSVTTADVTGSAGEGILASTEGGSVTVDSTAGTVTGLTNGIVAVNNGTSDTTITTADVTGTSTDGISALNATGAGDLIIDTSAGAVSGSIYGITTDNNGTGDTTVTTSDVSGRFAVSVIGRESSGDLTIDTTNGTVTGSAFGLRAIGRSSGAVSVTTADVTSTDDPLSTAVSARGAGASVTVDTTAGSIMGGAGGVNAVSEGALGETLSITTGDVTTIAAYVGAGSAVFARAESGNVIIDTTAGDLVSFVDGVSAEAQNGSLIITTANVTAQTGDGIIANNNSFDSDTVINTAAGSVSAALDGINVDQGGARFLSIVTANVTGGENGIFARSNGIDVTINSAAGAVTGGIAGIDAQHDGTGTVAIITADVTGNTGDGISAVNQTQGADLIINSVAGSVAGAEAGIDADNNGAGALIITSAGAAGGTGAGISADNGANGTDILLNTASGDVSGAAGIIANNLGTGGVLLSTGDVTGDTGNGIDATNSTAGLGVIIDSAAGNVTGADVGISASNSGSSVLLVTTADVTGSSAEGILTLNTGVDTIINSVAGTVGGGTDGISAANSVGLLVVNTATVTGASGDGITATNAGSELIINSSAGSVTGFDNGIAADNQGSSILNITAADVTGQNGAGITATNSGTDLLIFSDTGSVSGQADGIAATNVGTGFLSVISGGVEGATGDGIIAVNLGTDLVVNSTAGGVSGAVYGIQADNVGTGLLSITTADVIGAGDDAILAINTGTDAMIDTTAGIVSGGDDGINVRNSGSGVLRIDTGNVSGNGDNAIEARNYGTDLIIDTSGGAISGRSNGIIAINNGSGLHSIVTSDVTAEVSAAIYAFSRGTDFIVDTSAGTVTGGQRGINARLVGTGALSITSADVEGSMFDGISADNDGTDITIDSTAGTVASGFIGIRSVNNGSGSTTISTADVTGRSFDALFVINTGTDVSVDTSAGIALGARNGIFVDQAGSGSASIVTSDVQGVEAAGINIVSSGGTVSIDSGAGTVVGNTAGVFADQQSDGDLTLFVNEVMGGVGIDTQATTGATSITLSPTAIVMSTEGFAIDARSTGGDISIQGSSGMVSGAADGIYVRSDMGDIAIDTIDLVQGLSGDGLDLVSDGGDISVTAIDLIIGAAGSGIFANSGEGNVDIAGNGDISGAQAGIVAQSSGAGEISVDVSGITFGDSYGIDVSTQGGSASLFNSGTLSGGSFAVFASGDQTGPVSLVNTGTVGEAISFAGADDRFENSGLFIASGTSDFGDGTDVLANLDMISVADSAQFLRLEQLSSDGLITLANGAANGSLTTSGDFIGSGGTLALDVDFATNLADVFTIGGAATGVTQLNVNLLNSNATFEADILIVDGGAGTEAGAFVIDAATLSNSPFFAFELDFDAAANDFTLGLSLQPQVFGANKLAEGTQSLWYRSADTWGDHRANTRFADDDSSPIWAVMYGAVSNRDETFTDLIGITGDAVLDYSQDFFGIQAGVEKRLGETLTAGISGGYLNSNLRLEDRGTSARFDVLNIGASVSWQSGGFFADALVKYDSIQGVLSDVVQGSFSGRVDGSAFGARIETGYRIGNDGFYAEPHVALDLQRTNLDDLSIASQTFEFSNLNGLRGAAGLRLGGYAKSGANTTIGYYLDASAMREFDGKANTRFSIASDSIEFQNNPIDTYAHLEAGITLDTKGPVSGFFNVETDLSSDYTSFGGNVGIRIKF